ncbi:MAG TPA: molybdopterin molybdotransferase MoeA [Micropepsaceae bacterium]|nr:molybdopterin molybdotransferase MoeA [Micropepsaceae bacterium]
MIAVGEARARILAALAPLGTETVPVGEASGRVVRRDVIAARSHPAADLSAMDGYAVRGADVAHTPAVLALIGEAPAGGRFPGSVKSGEAVRILTGGIVPDGADTIIIQENVSRDGSRIIVNEPGKPGKHFRRAGMDFAAGDVLARAGEVLSPAQLALIAAGNVSCVETSARPRVALLATGDEIVAPGTATEIWHMVGSSGLALGELIRTTGGTLIDLGIVRDDIAAIRARVSDAPAFDLLVTLGGASVGDHDLVKPALEGLGFRADFWKIAMRPGKPLSFGTLGKAHVMGIPGNPVSAYVCAVLFLQPAIRALQGALVPAPRVLKVRLQKPMTANDGREDYVRGIVTQGADGVLEAVAHDLQDSSALLPLARSNALLIRPPHAPTAAEGALVDVILLGRVHPQAAEGAC